MLNIKVCGMRKSHNISDLSKLDIDFIGLIFYEKSPRFLGDELKNLDFVPQHIKKIGVFVNENTDKMLSVAKKYDLDGIQLHGEETPEVCEMLKIKGFTVIKAFNIIEKSDFEKTKIYENVCDFFLFDTKISPLASQPSTLIYGGSGQKFDWTLLNDYQENTPFFLSGGIQAEDAENIKKIQHPRLFGIDLNSGFETQPAMKNIELLRKFICNLEQR